MRSTGLGTTELVAEINDCCPRGDHLVLDVRTVKPVKWKVRCTMTFKDIRRLMWVCMKLPIMMFMLNISRWFRDPRHPGDF